MFYEFRELTPIGRRGDEMIRRLADRLVAVDLLDQAAELLQYQVDKRLEGSARAQVAAKLAMVYLANRKPDLRASPRCAPPASPISPANCASSGCLLEARAQSDIGRHDLALDIVSNLSGREAIRLRSDIYWAARRWREASEQIELYYGDRWRDFKPLNPAEKSDVIRAVVGYALADDAIGLARFREKYAPLMSGEADKLAFDTASKPRAANSGDFAAIAKMAASVDTLDGFLREMKTRFPDATARTPLADPNPTGSLPKIDRRAQHRGLDSRRSARIPSTGAAQTGNLRRRTAAGGTMSKPKKTQAELIAMARAELKVHADCPDGIQISVLRDGDSWEFRAAPTRRPRTSPAIPNASPCWCRSATICPSSMMWRAELLSQGGS